YQPNSANQQGTLRYRLLMFSFGFPKLWIHALSQIYQGLVEGVHTNQTQAWVLEIQYDIDSERHDQRKANHMEPTAHPTAGHAIAGSSEAASANPKSITKTTGGGCISVAMVRVVVISNIALSAWTSSIGAAGEAPSARLAATACRQICFCNSLALANSCLAATMSGSFRYTSIRASR